jgi:dTDP-L-rhamnose 4-epimerase
MEKGLFGRIINMKNILITGGAGFIGSAIALELIKNGYAVTVLDNLTKQIHGNNPESSFLYSRIKDKVNFIRGDVSNRTDWERALKDQDAAIHLAAETGTGQSMYEIEKYCGSNIYGTALLLDILINKKISIQKLVLASSRAVYGEGKYLCDEHGFVYPDGRLENDMLHGDFENKCPICRKNITLKATDEMSKIHPSSIYGITKQIQEQMVLLVCKAINVPAVAFRYQNVYGPGQSLKNPYTGILSIFSTNFIHNRPINIFEDGQESRDFVYIDDVVNATILGLEKHEADFEIFNIGSGKCTTVLKVAEILKCLYGSESEISVTGNFRLGDIRHNFADISKIKKILGFSPQYNFDQGIKKFSEWVKQERVEKDNEYQHSLEEMKNRGLFK